MKNEGKVKASAPFRVRRIAYKIRKSFPGREMRRIALSSVGRKDTLAIYEAESVSEVS